MFRVSSFQKEEHDEEAAITTITYYLLCNTSYGIQLFEQ